MLFAFMVCNFLSLSAQIKQPFWYGDTLGPWSVISFEAPTDYIHIVPTTQNLWQIGHPQKPYFSAAYTVPNAIVTDTINSYPINNQSSFDLCIGEFNSNGGYYYNLFIDFRHKIDTDTLRDGGYISISWDHRQTWMNILDDTVPGYYYFVTPSQKFYQFGNTNLYSTENTLFNGEHGFSGKSNGWVHSCMAWYNLPVKHPDFFTLPDTMFLRFNFISDDIDHNKEGWMIDQIRIFSMDLGSGISEYLSGTKKAYVVPNPLKISADVTLDKIYGDVEYVLLDPSGRVIMHGNPGKCSEFSLNRGSISAGLYLLKISVNQNYSEVHRIVIQD